LEHFSPVEILEAGSIGATPRTPESEKPRVPTRTGYFSAFWTSHYAEPANSDFLLPMCFPEQTTQNVLSWPPERQEISVIFLTQTQQKDRSGSDHKTLQEASENKGQTERPVPDCIQMNPIPGTEKPQTTVNHENRETPGAAKPQPKEKTAKDAKSAKTDFFVSFALFAVE